MTLLTRLALIRPHIFRMTPAGGESYGAVGETLTTENSYWIRK